MTGSCRSGGTTAAGSSSTSATIRAIVATACDRVPPDAGLAGEHHRVGAVEHRVGHVRRLGPGRPGVLDHRLEHLGRDDHRLGRFPASLHGPLLHQRHLLQRHLHAEVAAGHHDPVERGHAPRRGRRPPRASPAWRAPAAALPTSAMHSPGPARRRPGDRTNDSATRSTPSPSANRRSSASLSGQRRHAHRDARQGQALVVGRPDRPRSPRRPRRGPATATTTRPTLPSSTSSRSPGATSSASCRYVVDTRSRGARARPRW